MGYDSVLLLIWKEGTIEFCHLIAGCATLHPAYAGRGLGRPVQAQRNRRFVVID
jgi:hypothetical protein